MATIHHDDRGIRRALLAGIFANLGVAVAKFAAYLATRSAAMLAFAAGSACLWNDSGRCL